MTQETDIIKVNKILDSSKGEMDIILDRWSGTKSISNGKKSQETNSKYIIDLNVKVETKTSRRKHWENPLSL